MIAQEATNNDDDLIVQEATNNDYDCTRSYK